MDPFKLLSRSTGVSKKNKHARPRDVPPSGRTPQPQLFSAKDTSTWLGKRKRETRPVNDELDFFAAAGNTVSNGRLSPVAQGASSKPTPNVSRSELKHPPLALEERKRVLKQHKIKVTMLNQGSSRKRSKLHGSYESKTDGARCALFPSPILALNDVQFRFGASQRLCQNVLDQGYQAPTEVQLAALPLLLDETAEYIPDSAKLKGPQLFGPIAVNLLTVAPTGSGKTLAFLIPLLQAVFLQRQAQTAQRRTSAIILAPTKELASQITNEGRKLAKGTGITVTLVRKGMTISDGREGEVSAETISGGGSRPEPTDTATKADIIISTPGTLQTIINEAGCPLPGIRYFILDEADVLLDPMFREQTMVIWNSLPNPDLRVSMWSATMGSNIEELVTVIIADRCKRLSIQSDTDLPAGPLIRLVVGLKDSAVPNVSHRLVYAATEKGKLMGLRQMLHPSTSSAESGPPLRPPFLVFTQTVERAIALNSELVYDVPPEAGGSSRIAVLHSDLSDTARDNIMTRFRKGEIWILITTDLLSRGVDFRGVNGVVNYDIPTSSAAYVHRIGRTGRAGRDGGVAVTLYGKEDVPYLKHVANVAALSQKQGNDKDGVQQWLLDALPKLSKNEKKNLKQRGIESRTARGQKKDPRAAQKSRISTKAGFIRQLENKRKGAVLGTQRRLKAEVGSVDGGEEEFTGFD